jgi:hypothetical protein
MDEKEIGLSHVEQLEQGLAKERARRDGARVERGEAVKAELWAVCGGAEDADAALAQAKADKLKGLKASGEARYVVWTGPVDKDGVELSDGPLIICTGVPRPGRDPLYAERIEREAAEQTAEQRRQQEAEAAKKVEAYHEAAKSHEPEPSVSPLKASFIPDWPDG